MPTTAVARSPRPHRRLEAGPELVTGLILPILALNLADALFTLGWIDAGLASEGNPLMATLIALHPSTFAVTKLGLVGLGLALLHRRRRRRVAQVAAALAFVVYVGILCFHLQAVYTLPVA
ncbi:DUF5658 family protein [Myxococcota bacterium]|nr:DUF5658 family protein [Myxococcota bacterium]